MSQATAERIELTEELKGAMAERAIAAFSRYMRDIQEIVDDTSKTSGITDPADLGYYALICLASGRTASLFLTMGGEVGLPMLLDLQGMELELFSSFMALEKEEKTQRDREIAESN